MKDEEKVIEDETIHSEYFFREWMRHVGPRGTIRFIFTQDDEEVRRMSQDELDALDAEEVGGMSPDAEEAFKDRLVDITIKIFAGAAHFANISPLVTDIARAAKATPEEVRNWVDTSIWKYAVKMYGWTGDPTPQEELLSENDPVPLRESFLINKAFQKEKDGRVRFVTYDGFANARVTYVERYYFMLQRGDDKHAERLQKHDVVLAFPEKNMPFVKKGIKRRESITDLDLRPIKRVSEQAKIDVTAPLSSIVECVMRNGLVVTGEYVWNSRYYMVLRVGGPKGKGGKIIIVYKHALLAFQVIKQRRKRKKRYRDDWDNEENPNR